MLLDEPVRIPAELDARWVSTHATPGAPTGQKLGCVRPAYQHDHQPQCTTKCHFGPNQGYAFFFIFPSLLCPWRVCEPTNLPILTRVPPLFFFGFLNAGRSLGTHSFRTSVVRVHRILPPARPRLPFNTFALHNDLTDLFNLPFSGFGPNSNISFNPPQVPGLDDITGEPLSKRPDDTPEVFGKRLDTFHEMTEPILAHYAQQAATTLTNEDIAAPPGSSPEQQRALGLTLRQELSAVPLDRAVQVTLSGTSSNAIWPLLERVVDARFQRDRPVNQGQAQAQAQAAPDPPCSPDPPRQPHREKIAPGS